jgi:hypothetical protein
MSYVVNALVHSVRTRRARFAAVLLLLVAWAVPALAAATNQMEIPMLLWGDSKRPDGSIRHWDPQPAIDLHATLLCVAYRPTNGSGERWYGVGMTPPMLLRQTLGATKPELDECHQHGIKVIGYADCIMFHTNMLDPEGIDCGNLYAIDRNGKPIVNRSWDKSGAGVSCVSNPQWVRLQKEVTRITAEAGFDGLQFDVYPYAIGPGYLCCCQYCKEEWSRQSAKLFGAPQPMPGLDSGKLDFRNPVDRAFVIWRWQEFVDFVKSIEDDIHKSHPGFIIIMNHGAGTPDYTYEAAQGGLDCPSTELWHLKLGDASSLYLYSGTEAANGTKAIGLINLSAQRKPDYRYRVALAEAFGGGGTFYGDRASKAVDDTVPTTLAYYDFFRTNQEWFNDTRPDATTAVLYSWRDQIFLEGDPVVDARRSFDPKRAQYQRAAAVLARMGIPNDCLLVEKWPAQAVTSRYQVIVAPDLSLVDDKTAKTLKKYIRQGGCLLVIGDFGTINQRGPQFEQRNPSLLTAWTGRKPEGTWAVKMGRGTIAYASSATLSAAGATPVPPEESDGKPAPAKEKPHLPVAGLPPSQEFLAAAEGVGLGSQLRITGTSPIEATIRAKGGERAIHLIRFGPTDDIPDKAVSVDYELPQDFVAGNVLVRSPDFPEGETHCSWENAGNRLRVTISAVDHYALLAVTLKPVK